MQNIYQAVVVGGGLTGIMAMRTLKEKGIDSILLLEKNVSIGGRLATVRFGEALVDYGAQFFSVRSATFRKSVDQWLQNGLIEHWFGESHPRYRSVGGMEQLVTYLAQGIELQLDVKVEQILEREEGFLLYLEDGESIYTESLVITAPAPQAVTLLKQVQLRKDAARVLSDIHFHPCLVALLGLNAPFAVGNAGYRDKELPEGIERIVDHQQKGMSSLPSISIYMTGTWSSDWFEKQDEEILEAILKKVNVDINPQSIQMKQLKRWSYAEASRPARMPFLEGSNTKPLFIAGDAFLYPEDSSGRTRMETAFLSGIAVGEALAQRLTFHK
ncbi:NAD(P)/FAD-dependent oxidoreductase [Ammoniphilus sp. YIM 78166]|uniref:NAD(P)/FAD-dependent oxidoreductase n=1 Tax=Ammoniphilus sp. YIM 78166 TaxID=1644106 RepID=UPI00106FCFEB|nr:FAD-dependent oxidoreductase [Ammoniphilus sp. YIM 78166]